MGEFCTAAHSSLLRYFYPWIKISDIYRPNIELGSLVCSSQEAEFSIVVVQCHSSCISRQVHEAVQISQTDAEIIQNSEFHQAPLIGVVATSGLQEEQTSACSQGVGSERSSSQGRRSSRAGRRGRGRGGPGAGGGGWPALQPGDRRRGGGE